MVVVKNEIKVARELLKATDEKAKELIHIVKENTKKVHLTPNKCLNANESCELHNVNRENNSFF